MMRKIGFVLLLSLPAMAAVTGTVINRSTGQPQAGATVALNRLGQGGIELIDQAKSDAQGKFTINQQVQGPHVIRTAFDGVTYNHMLPPGSPTTDLTIDVYNASTRPGDAKVSKHMILLEPSGGQMVVQETYLFTNAGKTAWNDPDNGTLHFFLPATANGQVKVEATAPGGMPIPAATNKSRAAETYQVDFPVKPGDTRFDLTYSVPYTEGSDYSGRVLTKDEDTYVIVPNGVTLAGAGLNDMGTEPRTQSHIYGLRGSSYKVQLTGSVAAAPADSAGGDPGDQQESSGPPLEQIMPRVNDQTKLILGLTLGILALGFVLLYRAQPAPAAVSAGAPPAPAQNSTAGKAKEANERGRG
jgi:hypothetical protein